MPATLALPALADTIRRAVEVYDAWTADREMPVVAGCVADAVRVLAVRAAVHEATGDEGLAALPAPVAVELSALMLDRQFPELRRVMERTGHRFISGAMGTRWRPGDYVHRAYTGAFGQAGGRHWPV